mgnify:CR=1 FL=1
MKSDIDLKLIETDTKRMYYWIKKAGLRLFRKKKLSLVPIDPASRFNFLDYIYLKCKCGYYWVENTQQTILLPSADCLEHRAEIAENVSKEDWENLLKVNETLGPKNTHRGIGGSGGFTLKSSLINNQGGNTP